MPFIEDSSKQLPTTERLSATNAKQSTATAGSSELTNATVRIKAIEKPKTSSLLDALKTSYAEELAKESKDSKSTGALPKSSPETSSKATPEKGIFLVFGEFDSDYFKTFFWIYRNCCSRLGNTLVEFLKWFSQVDFIWFFLNFQSKFIYCKKLLV